MLSIHPYLLMVDSHDSPLRLLSVSHVHQRANSLQYYDFPVVSMRSAVWRNMAAGVEGFRVSQVRLLLIGGGADHVSAQRACRASGWAE